MTNVNLFRICIGLLLGHGITSGIMNPGSISAAGAAVGAGLFSIAIALSRDSASIPLSTAEPVADGNKAADKSQESSVAEKV